MAKITLNPPENLAEFTDMVEKYVNQEETLAALRESWKGKVSESKSFGKNKKVRQEEKRTETKAATRPTKYYQFQIEEWTLLNSPINGDQKRSGV
jgi:hypothetical protein